MHALYFGNRLAAIDLGLSDGDVFHSWMVAYDDELSEYAPGIQLLEGLIDATPDTGYKRIDMGEGLDGYKRRGVGRLKDAPGKLRRRYSQIAACEDNASDRVRHMIAAFKSSVRK